MKERQKAFFRILVPATLLVILVVFLATYSGDWGKKKVYLKKEIQLSTDCSDAWDFWSRWSREEKNQECQKRLFLHVVELGQMGFSPGDCRPTKVKLVSCEPGQGHQLICHYFCQKRVE